MNYEKREDIPIKYQWDLTKIFESVESWEIELEKIGDLVKKVTEYKGKIAQSKENFRDILLLDTELSVFVEKVYMYAHLTFDLDNGDAEKQAMHDKTLGVYFSIQEELSFVVPEISAIEENTLREWVACQPELAQYSHSIDNIIRNKMHVLSEKEERLLALVSPTVDSISSAFEIFNSVDIDLGEVTDEDGNKVKLTHGLFGKFRDCKKREVRAEAFEKMHTTFEKMGNTIATLYSGSVRSDVFYSKARGYENSLDKALFSDNLPRSIYTGLVDAVRANIPANLRYLELRRKIMGLDKLHIYDTYLPIIDVPKKEYDYETACEMVCEAMAPLGQQYVSDLRELLSGGFVDVYEVHGKPSGAYATSIYGVSPFMLLNFTGQLNDVFTLAHEAGHCMHSLYSDKRHYENKDYPIFLAEIASTVNENILMRGMIAKCDTSTKEGKLEKAYLINHFLEEFKGTVFRQTMFAEFELKVHEMAENNEPLTAVSLCEVYAGLLRDYFGENVVIDDFMKWEWSRIPHFYRAFYVYKYSTGFSAATAITHNILNDKSGENVKKYIEFLHAGGSDYPAETLKKAGVDLTTPKPVNDALAEFENLVDELENLINTL